MQFIQKVFTPQKSFFFFHSSSYLNDKLIDSIEILCNCNIQWKLHLAFNSFYKEKS